MSTVSETNKQGKKVANNGKNADDSSPSSSVADEWNASILQIVTFSWLLPLIKVGYSRQLKETPTSVSFNCPE